MIWYATNCCLKFTGNVWKYLVFDYNSLTESSEISSQRKQWYDNNHQQWNKMVHRFWIAYDISFPYPCRQPDNFRRMWSNCSSAKVDFSGAECIAYHFAIMMTTSLKFNVDMAFSAKDVFNRIAQYICCCE